MIRSSSVLISIAAIYIKSTLERSGDAVSTRSISDHPTPLKTPFLQWAHVSRRTKGIRI